MVAWFTWMFLTFICQIMIHMPFIKARMKSTFLWLAFVHLLFLRVDTMGQEVKASCKVISFYTAKNDAAHISFVHEANNWFPRAGATYGFSYDSTSDWNNLNEQFLS